MTADTLLPVQTYADRSITIEFLNPFRFDYNPASTVTPIQGATPPSQLAPPSQAVPQSAAAKTSPAPVGGAAPAPGGVGAPQKTGKLNPPTAPRPPQDPTPIPADCIHDGLQSNIWDTPFPNQSLHIDYCWNKQRTDVVGAQSTAVAQLRQAINDAIRDASREQDCYTERTLTYSQPILSTPLATDVLLFAGDNEPAVPNGAANGATGCRVADSTAWPLTGASATRANNAEIFLMADKAALDDIATAPGYDTWLKTPTDANSIAATALTTAISGLLTEVRSYQTGTAGSGSNAAIAQTLTDFKKVVATNNQWRDRLHNIVAAGTTLPSNSLFTKVLRPKVCNAWYGKGSTEVVSLKYTDITGSTTGSGTTQVVTNTCNPLSIASTGVGVSFLSNPTYAFVPDGKGNQVIGETATNNVMPLYGLFYNVLVAPLGRSSGVELFVSPGVGLTSASSTTTTDFLGGLSLGLGRRLLFVTGSADIGQRTQLISPYTLGSPQTVTPSSGTAVTLSTVPTQTAWRVGFMVSISFGIAPSN